jgi:hypothetical protein
MLRLLLAAPLAMIALPAVAQDHGPQAVSDALAKGCRVQQVHTPAGKLVHNSPIVKCDQAQTALADKQPNQPQAIVMQ